MPKWKTAAPGIRYREHESRRHGKQADRYFTLRITVNGRQVEEGLGWASGGWTLSRAQEELGRLREAKRTGRGPQTLRERRSRQREQAEAEAHQRRAERRVCDLWERYERDVVARNKPTTRDEKLRIWRRRIEPAIGRLLVKDITEEDVSAIVRAPLRLDASGTVIGGKAEAGNTYRLLHHVFAKALIWGLRPRQFGNPLEGIDEPKASRRERLLTAGEITALLQALDEAREEPQVIGCARAIVLTGCRVSELLRLRWEDIRRDEMALHLVDTKTGFSRRTVSLEAIDLLLSIDRVPGSRWVFRSIRSPREPLPYDTFRKGFDRIVAAASIEGCSPHTIRHWFVTGLANRVSNPRVGMMVSGHRSTQSYLQYVHSHEEQARALAGQLGELVTSLGQGKPNVVPLPSTTKR